MVEFKSKPNFHLISTSFHPNDVVIGNSAGIAKLKKGMTITQINNRKLRGETPREAIDIILDRTHYPATLKFEHVIFFYFYFY